MNNSGFMLAGFEILSTIIDGFFFSPNFKKNFTKEDLQLFFSKTCSGMLHSFGTNFAGRKRYDKFIKKEIRILDYCRNLEFYNKTQFVLDSGGYTISIGLLNRRETHILYDSYYKFLIDNKSRYDKAFILDLPPGPNCCLFKSFKDVYDWNKKSYIEASQFPQDIRDNIIYIHHFRTPKLWDIYTKIMDDYDLFDKFNIFGTGGMVANSSTDLVIPCLIYVLPLVPLLKRTIDFKRKILNFHVLGAASFRDVFFYELFSYHVMKKHQIELNITYDSSNIFKSLMIGRFIHIVNEGSVFKTDIRSLNLDKRHKEYNLKIIDIYRDALNNFADENNFKRINLDNIYDLEKNTFHEDVRLYSMLYVLNNYSTMHSYFRNIIPEIYKLYENKNFDEFSKEVELITRRINSEKITKKQKAKSRSIIRSLEMLEDLDENHCKYLVNKFLAKDEFIELERQKIYTF